MSDGAVRRLLRAAAVDQRLEGLALAQSTGAGLGAALPLLDDDAPYLFDHGAQSMVAEVRAQALVTLEELTRLSGRAPDFGPVKVRRAMPARAAIAAAADCYARLADDDAERLRRRVDRFLDERVRPAPEARESLHAYRTLQALGLVAYREEEVDPRSYRTPLQQTIHDSQMQPARPTPCLRISDAGGEILGYVYRRPSDPRWSLDFAEAPPAQAALRFTRAVFTLERGGVPRVRRAPDGAPLTADDGSLLLDGVVPTLTEDTGALLHSLAAFVGRRYAVEIQ